MAQLFEQQPGESAKAFAGFSDYLSMGAERSLEAVRVKCGKNSRLIQRWSSRWKWAERVQAYAERLALVEREAAEALAREKGAEWLKRQQAIREEGWTVSDECVRGAREALKRFYEKGKGATLGDIARMYAEGIRLGRLSAGLATDATEMTGQDGGPIRLELEAALKKVYGDIVDVEAAAAPHSKGEGNALPEPRAKSAPGTDEGK
jgi:hypothetical protein